MRNLSKLNIIADPAADLPGTFCHPGLLTGVVDNQVYFRHPVLLKAGIGLHVLQNAFDFFIGCLGLRAIAAVDQALPGKLSPDLGDYRLGAGPVFTQQITKTLGCLIVPLRDPDVGFVNFLIGDWNLEFPGFLDLQELINKST